MEINLLNYSNLVHKIRIGRIPCDEGPLTGDKAIVKTHDSSLQLL